MTDPGVALNEALDEIRSNVEVVQSNLTMLEGNLTTLEGRVLKLEEPVPPPPPPPPPTTEGEILISKEELLALPKTGAAWGNVLTWADMNIAVDVHDQNNQSDAVAMAKAIVYGVNQDEGALADVISSLESIIAQSFDGQHTLDISRNLGAFVIAADIIDLPKIAPELDEQFRTWLKKALTVTLAGRAGLHTMVASALRDPTNHGTHSRASVLAAALYLAKNETTEEAKAEYALLASDVVNRFKDWVSGTNSSVFIFKELWWQANPDAPVAINPLGASIEGHDVGGVLPEEQRRSGAFSWPAPVENYVREAQQGVLATALIVERLGHTDVWDWGQKAILRSFLWFYEVAGGRYTGDDNSLPYLIKAKYGFDYISEPGTEPGKNGLGWYELFFGGGE